MDIGSLLDHLGDEWVVVTGAPVLTITAAIILAAVMAVIFRAAYRVRIGNLKSIIDLNDRQVADYKDKLSGATPDEARARFAALEARLVSLEPRRLTYQQQQTIAATTRALASQGLIALVSDQVAQDGLALRGDFENAFKMAGWHVETWAAVSAEADYVPSGLALIVGDATSLSAAEQTVADALHAAKIPFDLRAPHAAVPFGMATFEIRVLPKLPNA